MLRLLKKEDKIWFWEEGYHGEEIISISFFESKMLYIHLNPVRAGLVEKEVEYLYSSCGDLYGVRKGLLELAVFQISELADWKSFLYVLRDALRNISNSGVEDN